MNKQFEIAKESKQPENLEKGTNYKKLDFGLFEDFGKYVIENKNLKKKSNGKVFLHDLLDLTSTEVSINCAPVGFKVPFKHTHNQNEELYIVLKGKGVIEVDDNRLKVKEGSIVKITPKGIRTIENTGEKDFIFIVIQAKEKSLEQFTLTDAKVA